jgi:hypothetical protein
MRSKYHARWVSKGKAESLRKFGLLAEAILVGHLNGFIVVEPAGSKLGDGQVLSPEVADYELRTAWCQAPRAVLTKARQLLGLDPEYADERLVPAI